MPLRLQLNPKLKVLKKNKPSPELEATASKEPIEAETAIVEVISQPDPAKIVRQTLEPVADIIRQQLQKEETSASISPTPEAVIKEEGLEIRRPVIESTAKLPTHSPIAENFTVSMDLDKPYASVIETIIEEAPQVTIDLNPVPTTEPDLSVQELSLPLVTQASEVEQTDAFTDELPAVIETINKVPLTFEAYFQTQVINEEPITLETITETANEQPPEQVLAQFIQLVSEQKTTTETENLYQETIDKIEIALPACVNHLETGETIVHMSPELTGALVELFETLGYNQPEIVLEQMIATRGVEFVIEACQQLCQTQTKPFRLDTQEFLNLSQSMGLTNDTSKPLKLGKLLLRLLRQTPAPWLYPTP